MSVKNKRTWLILLLVGGSLLGLLAACGSDDPTSVPPATATSAPPTATLAPGEPTLRPTATTAALVATTPATTPPFDAVAHFKGKTIRMVVGFNPGGGTDSLARYLAARLPDFIPGKPRMVVTTITPTVADINYLVAQKPNGLTLHVYPTPDIDRQYGTNAKYKSAELIYIGASNIPDLSWIVHESVAYSGIEDAAGGTDPLIFSITSPAPVDLTGQNLQAMMLAEAYGFPLELRALGSAGTAGQLIALERGDINSMLGTSYWVRMPQLREGWLSNGTMRPFLDFSNPDVEFPESEGVSFDAPNVWGMLDEEQTRLFRAVGYRDMFDKSLRTVPGTPDEIVAVLRQAWRDATDDPEFLEGYKRLFGEAAVILYGEDLQKANTQYDDAYASARNEIEGILVELGAKYVR
jgi:tripartite-type tricarboxylate transporter receptor subunit TctC